LTRRRIAQAGATQSLSIDDLNILYEFCGVCNPCILQSEWHKCSRFLRVRIW